MKEEDIYKNGLIGKLSGFMYDNTEVRLGQPSIRTFETGATRDTSEGKLDYYGFREPRLEQSFAKYMHSHRKQSDGSMRSANNWWGGWDREISLQSLVRHIEDLQALHAGYNVFELRHTDGSIEKVYTKEEIVHSFSGEVKVITEEECCNAIKFNSHAYLLQVLK